MRNPSNQDSNTKTDARACAFVIILLLLLAALGVGPLTTTKAQTAAREAEQTRAEAGAGKLGQDIDEATSVAPGKVPGISPEAVTATSYPFSSLSGISLEDMSSGTTQLVAANLDDNASPVTNIGFDFWYDGVRFTQFSVNANGLARLGATAVSTSFDNASATTGFATATNAPKIAPYYDDLWTGTNGKVHFKVVGSAPNRKLVVEWLNEQIPRVATGNAGAGTFQMWLFETTGVIEFVYGNGIAVNSANGGYTVGLQSGAATNLASVTTSTNTVSYAAANNTQTNAIAAGTAYIFTPNVPAAPTGYSATGVAQTSLTLNWTDNASNEVGYVIYQSTDGVNYTFVTQTAANATSQVVSGLHSNTNYFFNVYAVTEGALSAALSGSQATLAGNPNISTAAGGLWSSTATWAGGVVPTATDNVTIVNGANVTIDTAAVALNVTVASGGTLTFDATTARTLAVGEDVSVNSGGTFASAATGTVTTHVLTVSGNLTNNGTLDFSTNADTAGAGIIFTGATSNTFGGTGATTDIRTLTINKGASNVNTLELNPTNFTVQSVNTDVAGYLTLTNGTFKVSGAFTITNRTFTAAAYTIPATAGFWLNNPNYTVAGQNGSPTESGLLRITQGTFNIGTATGNSMGFSAGSTVIVEGGAVNATGRFAVGTASTNFTYNQSGGTITVCTVGNASTTLASFDLGTSTAASITMTGGTIVAQLASTAASGPRDYRNQAGSGILGVTGGTLQLGNAASGAAKAFTIGGVIPNLVITNTSANHTATLNTTLVNYNNISLNITINAGNTIDFSNIVFLFDGTVLTNNGTLTHTGASSNFVLFNAVAPVSYTGSGTVTAPMSNLAIQTDTGFTISPASPNIVAAAVRLFSGSVTNSNKLTLGNGGATSGVVQIGNTTTPTAAGTFDVPLTFNLGTGGEIVSYLRTTTAKTTGGEINPTRTLTTLTYDDNDVTHTLTIAGGDLTVTGTTTLTNGHIVTGANALAIGSAGTVTRTAGYVDGNLRKTYAAAGSKVFEVGTANGFSPVTVNATAGSFPSDFTARATQGPQPSVNPATSVQRYWTLNGTGITADLTFQYLATDVMGIEANYRVIRVIGGTSVSFPTSTVNTGTHTATLTGVSAFSDWTAGETSAPTAAPAIIRGQITSPDGNPLGGVIVNLGGSQAARTITDGNGMYRFDNIETGKLYVVKPERANYSFSPADRVFSLNADKTDAVFTATAASIPTGNPLDTDMYFVRQQYLDFLGREPDRDGLLYWTNELDKCGTDASCFNQRRIDISAAFFVEAEMQQTGSYVYRLYKGALGRRLSYQEYSADRQKVVGGDDLEANKTAFVNEFVERREFTETYGQATSAESFVDTLLANMQGTSGADLSSERNALIESYNNGASMNESRALALGKAIDAKGFKDAEYNSSFVLMEYFGYLKRDPETEGFQFWLNVLDNKEPGNYRGMVCSFITSAEYQQRFSPVTTRSNRECR